MGTLASIDDKSRAVSFAFVTSGALTCLQLVKEFQVQAVANEIKASHPSDKVCAVCFSSTDHGQSRSRPARPSSSQSFEESSSRSLCLPLAVNKLPRISKGKLPSSRSDGVGQRTRLRRAHNGSCSQGRLQVEGDRICQQQSSVPVLHESQSRSPQASSSASDAPSRGRMMCLMTAFLCR